MQPLELAKFWIDYVVRHKGALQLRSAGQDLSFFAYHNLDVFVFLAVSIICVILGSAICLCGVFKFVATILENRRVSREARDYRKTR